MTSFWWLVRAEMTKFATVRVWAVALLAGGIAIVGFGLLPGMQGSCGKRGPGSECSVQHGPDGQEVTDRFYFVHQPLAGDATVTVRVTSLTGILPSDQGGGGPQQAAGDSGSQTRPGVAPWTKAGLMIKASTQSGSAYAAVMVTGGHGVRMQDDYTHDVAGRPGAVSATSPRWLRLVRAADTVTAYESSDGSNWTEVGAAHVAGLPSTAQVGLFVASPQYSQIATTGIMTGDDSGPSQATAVFDRLTGAGPQWTGDDVGGTLLFPSLRPDGFSRSGDEFTVTGTGDIAPAVGGAAGLGTTVTRTLIGTFIGLIMVVVLGTLFITAEYRRGLIRTTLAASPRRGHVLAAKALVIGSLAFIVGLIAAAVVVAFGPGMLRANGVFVHATTTLTDLRLIVGTAALLAVAAVLALAIGTLLRRSAAAVAAVVVVIVMPYLLAITSLPVGAARWLLRVTPAAAFAVQQSTPQYFQVDNVYTPADGYFPLAPWVGFGVLCAWAAAAFFVAVLVMRRRDA